VDVNDPSVIYHETSFSPCNFLQNGHWTAINTHLKKKENSFYVAEKQPVPTAINANEGWTSIIVNETEIRNNQLFLLKYDAAGVTTIKPDWSNYSVGDDGLYVTNIFPSIDLRLKVYHGAVKTDFILKNKIPDVDKLVIRDKLAIPQGHSISIENANAYVDKQGKKTKIEGWKSKLLIKNENEKTYATLSEVKIYDSSGLRKNTGKGFYLIDEEKNIVDIPLYAELLDNDDLTYPVIIDPLLSASNTLPQASIGGSGGTGACNGWTVPCSYNVSVTTPSNVTITDINWSFNYIAQNGAIKDDGAVDFDYLSCRSPNVGTLYWTCQDGAAGTCTGTNISILSDFAPCVPAPQCSPYTMAFTMNFYDACGSACDNSFIGAASDWTMTVEGRTVEQNSIPTSSAGTTFCQGTSTTLTATGSFGVPAYSYSWSDGQSGNPISVTPATSTTYTCTITDACGITATNSITITVNSTPDATITSSSGPYCSSDPAFTLTAASGGGTWSGTGVSGSTFNPSTAGVGTHTISYNIGGACPSSDTEQIIVNSVSNATITSSAGPYCQSDPSFTLTSTDGGGTWSGTGVSGSTFNPASAGPGTFTVTYAISGSCGDTDTQSITVNADPDATITSSGTYCTSDAAFALTANTGGGSWSGPGVSGGNFDPSIAGVGTHNISYTVTVSGCTDSDTENIFVTAASNATITSSPGPYCESDAAFGLTSVDGGGTWSGTGVSGTNFNPSLAGAGTHTITYSISGSCGDTDTEQMIVNADPDATITPQSTLCTSDAAVALSAATAGGTWSGTGVSGGNFDPAIAGPGTHTITYSITVNGCSDSDTEQIIVVTNPDATITSSPGPYCTSDAAFGLTSVDGGGTWSGTGVSGTNFDPAIAGAGTHIITYDITSGTCSDSDTEQMIVNQTPDATITAVSTLCTTDPPVTLSAATGGGTWTGTGVSGGNFDPAIAGTGTHIITYDVTSGGCSDSDTEQIIVVTNPDATITSAPGPYCTSDAAFGLTSVDGGGTWSGTGVSGTNFDPAIAGAGTHTITYDISAGSCSDSDTEQIVVEQTPDATITPIATLCTTDPAVILNAATTGGTWTGPGGASGGTFDPSIAGAGTYTITYNVTSGSCSDSDTEQVIVIDNANATINAVGSMCSTDTAITLTAVTGGGTWAGNGITNAANGTFDPGVAGIGTHIITYSISGSCGDSDTEQIIVSNSANAAIPQVGPYCANGTPIDLELATNGGGTWSGTGITDPVNGTFDPASAGIGTHTITYTISGSCGDSDTQDIEVVAQQNAVINPTGTVCDNQGVITLSASTPGGTWSGPGTSSNGTFDPSGLGAGTYTVTYILGNPCPDTGTYNVVVQQGADATINPAGPFCADAGTTTLTAVQSGGSWSGTGIQDPSAGTFNPSLAGAGTHTITYSLTGTCGDTETILLIIYAIPDTPVVASTVVCNYDLQPLVSSSSGGSINWYSDPGASILLEGDTFQYIPNIDTTASSTTYTYYVQEQIGICKSVVVAVTYNVININASFEPDPDSGQVDLEVFFENNSIGVDDTTGIFNWDFGDGETSSEFEPTHTYEDKGYHTIILEISDSNGICTSIASFTIRAVAISDINLPNIFSPNGDNYNEVFNVNGIHLKSINAEIFNRWGQLIYIWNTVEGGWDGRTISGTIAPPGTYYYLIDAIGYNIDEITGKEKDDIYEFRGSVTLVR
ncbi:gliding motility-associated C-terminal domain-containing protein, partial [Bacteroidales bacterium AH-315-I05]|nr:gliding motility-associated C-terminal domain-containing protein [Bacteroidales bacterium AH-315-I05]